MDSDFITAISQAAGISSVVIAVLWTKFRGLDRVVSSLDDSVRVLSEATAVGNERLDQVEKRLGGNGTSVPARCVVHESRLGELERRVERFE